MEIVLYYGLNTCALAPYVTLTEANASFEVKPLNFRKNEQRLPRICGSIPSTRCRCLWSTGTR